MGFMRQIGLYKFEQFLYDKQFPKFGAVCELFLVCFVFLFIGYFLQHRGVLLNNNIEFSTFLSI